MPGLIDPDRLCVILVSTRNPLNIGAAAILTQAKVFATVAEAVADCTLVVGTTAIGHRQMQHPLHVLKDGASSILQELAAPPSHSSRVAILFGSEKVGL